MSIDGECRTCYPHGLSAGTGIFNVKSRIGLLGIIGSGHGQVDLNDARRRVKVNWLLYRLDVGRPWCSPVVNAAIIGV